MYSAGASQIIQGNVKIFAITNGLDELCRTPSTICTTMISPV